MLAVAQEEMVVHGLMDGHQEAWVMSLFVSTVLRSLVTFIWREGSTEEKAPRSQVPWGVPSTGCPHWEG